MSFKSGTIVKGMQNSGTPTVTDAAKNATVANVADADQRAQADQEIARQQATAKAQEKGQLHQSAQNESLPEGYARFVSSHKQMRFIKKNGETLYFMDGKLDTDDADAIKEIRESLKAGNNSLWEVNPKNVSEPVQRKTANANVVTKETNAVSDGARPTVQTTLSNQGASQENLDTGENQFRNATIPEAKNDGAPYNPKSSPETGANTSDLANPSPVVVGDVSTPTTTEHSSPGKNPEPLSKTANSVKEVNKP